jgi:HAD superfamily hydrolase (TIGR01509 family)
MNMILILDFDGVITKLNIDWITLREEVSKKLGFRVESMLEFWEKYHNTELFNLANEIVEKYEFEEVGKAKLYDDVKPALKTFNGTTYLASMQSERSLKIFLQKYDLKDYFKEVLGRERFGSKLRQVQYVIYRENNARRIILVDDSRRNISNCKALGIKSILFNRMAGDSLIQLINNLKQFNVETIDYTFSRIKLHYSCKDDST